MLAVSNTSPISEKFPAVKAEIRALRDKAHFFIAPSLETMVLALAGE
jgi:hypothetical protein